MSHPRQIGVGKTSRISKIARMSGSENPWHAQTRCAHISCGQRSGDAPNAPIIAPIVQSTLFDLGTSADAEALFSGERKGHAYIRFGNPTVDQLAAALCDLEGGGGALVTGSGNAATLCAITIAMAGRGGKLVTHPDIYGGSHELLRLLSSSYGLTIEVVDLNNVLLRAA